MHQNSKISKVGVEIEGGWKKGHKALESIYDDGSVAISNYTPVDDSESSENISGEICSSPMVSVRSLAQWIRESYPNTTNSTCGLHVHISTKKLDDYALLMHKKFYKIFLEGFERWGKKFCATKSQENNQFWERFNGENDYCYKEFFPIRQLEGRMGKYTLLNYSSFRSYKTVECRLLPAFKNPDKSVAATLFFVRLADRYLATMQPNDYTKKYLQALQKVL